MLAEEGLTIDRLIDFGKRAAETRGALDEYTFALLTRASMLDAYGVLHIDRKELLAVPRAIALRALSVGLQAVHTEEYAPPHASLSLLLDALRGEDPLVPRTLNGCRISQNKQSITIMREFSGITESATLDPGQTIVWDGRWQLALSKTHTKSCRVQALGNPPHEVLDRLAPDLRHKVQQGRIRAALPALWQDNNILVIPFHSQNDAVQAKLLTVWPQPR
jgi:tRNA(Ile)-lysidine synthase